MTLSYFHALCGRSLYHTDQYYGQPVTGSNAAEPYAYVSFFATAGNDDHQRGAE